MTTKTRREQLLERAAELGITDEEAGEPQWQAYLNDDQLEEAIERLRPTTRYHVECDHHDGRGWTTDGCWGGEYAVGMTEMVATEAVNHLRELYPDCEWRITSDNPS